MKRLERMEMSPQQLDELISQRVRLGDINEAFEDMRQGRVARTVITYG